MTELHRITKLIAHSGICSRREAETLIDEGRVKLDGKVVTKPAPKVPGDAHIKVDGKPIPKYLQPRMWLYHKPKGLITSSKDPQRRPTVFDNLPKDLPRVMSIGRLDLNSEGLLLLTNHSPLVKKLTDPNRDIPRVYRVRVFGEPTAQTLKKIATGVEIEGVIYKGAQVKIIRKDSSNIWLEVILTEGKNREIRKIFEHFGHPVSRLIRTQYADFKLGELKPWTVEEIPSEQVESLIKKFS